MNKQKTAYQKDFNWLTQCRENIIKAYYTICKQSFKVDNSGLTQNSC